MLMKHGYSVNLWGYCDIEIDLDNVQGLLADFLDNHEKFQLLNNNICSPTLHKEKLMVVAVIIISVTIQMVIN
jgi:hypothetical protein